MNIQTKAKAKALPLPSINNTLMAVWLTAILFFLFGLFNTAHAASAPEIWWPTEGVELHGTQPFKGMVQGMSLGDYSMYWQVDNGNLVLMNDNYADYPHKEASVDLSGWNWKGTGPYVLNFVAKDKNGQVVGQTTRTIYTGSKTPVSPSGTLNATVVSGTVTQTNTSISGQSFPTTAPASVSVSAPVSAPAPVVSSPVIVPSISPSLPLTSTQLYVDPNSQAAAAVKASSGTDATLLKKISENATAVWLGNWYSDAQTKDKITTVMSAAKAQNAIPSFVLYNIPARDCGSYSAGGVNSPDGYRSWINVVANAINGGKAIVVLEPDALPQSNCLSGTDQTTRFNLLSGAVSTLKAKGATVYLDAGHSGWKSVDEMAALLNKAGIAQADGFSLNVSNFDATLSEVNYGKQISAKVGNKHFVVDTSRNGNGSNGEWCNPSGRALGERPTTSTGDSLVDAYLWVKAPGESDGQCNGGPSAGTWWNSYALGLATLSRW
jgi:endoglucanase